jgi:hypothetical protein
MTDEEHFEDIQDLSAEIKRRMVASTLMAQQLAQHVEANTIMKRALNTAMVMIDQLLNDLRVAGGTPSVGLLNAKMNFDHAMKRVLGGEERSVQDVEESKRDR